MLIFKILTLFILYFIEFKKVNADLEFTACGWDEINSLVEIASDLTVHINFQPVSNVWCKCYFSNVKGHILPINPQLQLNTELDNCNSKHDCEYVSYETCSLEKECDIHTFHGGKLEQEFNQQNFSMINIWYHRIVLRFVSRANERQFVGKITLKATTSSSFSLRVRCDNDYVSGSTFPLQWTTPVERVNKDGTKSDTIDNNEDSQIDKAHLQNTEINDGYEKQFVLGIVLWFVFLFLFLLAGFLIPFIIKIIKQKHSDKDTLSLNSNGHVSSIELRPNEVYEGIEDWEKQYTTL